VRKGSVRGRIRERHCQIRSIVGDMSVNWMTSVQINPGTRHVYKWRGGGCSVRVQASRIDSFTGIVVQVKFDGDAVRDAASWGV
jgi:hypothetical protein